MTIKVGDSENYNAALDVRSVPLPADEVIETEPGAATSENVLVKCTLAARLRAVGETLTVDDPASDNGGWVVQEFTPTGVLEWSWTVTAEKPADAELRLDIRPAIAIAAAAEDLVYATQSSTSFNTDVIVDGNLLSRSAYWFEGNWGYVLAIAVPVGIAATALLRWWLGLRTEVRKARGSGAPNTDQPGPATE